MASHRSRKVRIVRYDGDGITGHADSVAVEDPIEIRLGDTPLAVTMRTPGDDDDLVVGFLITEGILLEPDEVQAIDRIDESRVSVRLRDDVEIDPTRFQRPRAARCSPASVSATCP